MITKEQILNSIQFVVNNSSHVTIKEENIENVVNLLKESKKEPWLNSDYLDLEKYSQDQILIYMILCESMNYLAAEPRGIYVCPTRIISIALDIT